MLIRSLSIKNFGPHENLFVDLGQNTPIVGVLGANGSGKSNILAALQYALTGYTVDTLESYIRDFDPAAKTNHTAVVEVKFVKHGVEGRITRKITKSGASREFAWGTAPIETKAAVVDKLVEELLGTDLKAVAVAGFIGQGDLDRLLFGDQAAREKLFLRLLGLEELPKTAEVIQNKIRLLLGQLEDLEPLRIAEEERVRSLQETVTQLSDETSKRADNLTNIAIIRQLGTLWEAMDTTERARLNGVAALDAVKKTAPEVTDVAQQELVVAQLRPLVAQAAQSITDADKRCQLLREIYALKAAAVTTSELTVEDATVAHTQATEALAETEREIAALNLQSASLKFAQSVHERVAQSEAAATSARSSLEEARRQLETAVTDLAAATQRLDAAREALPKNVNARIKVLEAAAEELPTQTGFPDDCACPVCASASVPTVDTLRKLANDLRENANAAFAVHTAAEQQVHALASVRDRAATTTAQAETLLTSRLEALTQDQAAASSVTAPEPDAVQSIQRALAEAGVRKFTRETAVTGARQRLQQAQAAETARQQAAGRLQQALITAALPEAITLVELAELGTKTVQLSAERTQSHTQLAATLTQQEGKLEAAREYQSQLEKNTAWLDAQVSAVTEARKAFGEALPNGIQLWNTQFPSRTVPALQRAEITELTTSLLPELERRQAERERMAGELKQAMVQLKQTEDALQLTRTRQAAQSNTLTVVRELETLAGAFKRGGVPMACLRRQFDQLTALANLALGMMDSNFAISTDLETPASFRFTRLDKSSTTVFDQSKLSGGQRVRLTVAFLLAVQQLILPELGLLVLDEPSLHLDAASIEQLRDLLVTTAQQFGGAEKQVWVCDHSPLLRSAFTKIVEL